jgi:hypothetical protein
VYNSIGRTGTKSKADPRHQKSSWECYYCNELAIFTENVHISWNKLLCYRICYGLHCSIHCQKGTSSLVRPVQNVIFTQTFSERII